MAAGFVHETIDLIMLGRVCRHLHQQKTNTRSGCQGCVIENSATLGISASVNAGLSMSHFDRCTGRKYGR
jgi:hypothetical protein